MHALLGHHQYETPGLSIPDASWDEIINLCEQQRHITRPVTEKWRTGWLCNAILHHGASRRRIADVERMASWIGLDVDHANWTLSDLLIRLGDLTCICYSTTRSTALERRWRVLLPVSREMTTAEFSGVWRACNLILDEEVDAATKNVNRLHYLPSAWIGGNNEYHVQDGSTLDVDELLECCPPEAPSFYTEVCETDGVAAPDGTEIISAAMIDRHMVNGRIGTRFFKLLCAAATRFKANGWALSASELANAALQVSPRDSSGLSRAISAYREAERALGYIDSRVQTLSPRDRLLSNLKWRFQQVL